MIECQDCLWVGEESELIAPTSSDEPGCPNCGGTDFLDVRIAMKWFDMSCAVTVSAYTQVEAETLEDAIEIASERSMELSFTGSGNDSKEVWLVDDIDGEPQNIHGEEKHHD